jgi:hypothetical protein
MRQALSKLETAILATIDTGAGRRPVKIEVLKETGCTMKELDQAIKGLRIKGLLRYEDQGTFLVANFARHHGKDIRQESGVYTYEDGIY